ncbi:hypothetical protein ACFDR9_005093 [Janthinobacterium sp. CG_23.3]|uniref:hypothetical protein n=1 Tax=Janthinobacterium sp. CG_23.3 TaxID=3349634 RepID=UPI0038D4A01E
MRTLIIGRGISAAAYLATLCTAEGNQHDEVNAVGLPHLWAKLPANHAMGQPSNLLAANLSRPAVSAHGSASSSSHGVNFMKAHEFSSLIEEQFNRNGCLMLDGEAEKISLLSGSIEKPEEFKIDYKFNGESIETYCNRVIIAVGPGPERLIRINDGDAPITGPGVVSQSTQVKNFS